MTTTSAHSIKRLDRRGDAERYRRDHPTLHVGAPTWETTPRGGRWSWTVEMEAGPMFHSNVELDTGDELDPTRPPDTAIGLTLAFIDALSYWKAAVPDRILVDGTLPGSEVWWDGFVATSMSEHLWRNGLDPTWLPTLEAGFSERPIDPTAQQARPDATLLLHSGGKDSITAAHLARQAGRAVRPISYQPTDRMRSIVQANPPGGAWAGPPVTMVRRLDPQILELNAAGYLNGHTPYSAWLAVAATAAADLCGIGHVAAGNGRSDDEPNIRAELTRGEQLGGGEGSEWAINHQWTKSVEFELAWAEISGPDRRYASPLRPLFEVAVLAGLNATPLAGASEALSCNRAAKLGREGTWCGHCPKCLWTAAALDAIAGPGAGVARLDGVDPLGDTANVELLEAMCGRSGPVPFECAGTPAEVRAVLREIHDRPDVPTAVASLPPDSIEARSDDAPLEQVVTDLGPAPLLSAAEREAAAGWIADSGQSPSSRS